MAAAALQYVRKISGTREPAAADKIAFAKAVEEVTASTERLLAALHPRGPVRTREGEREKGRLRWKQREERIQKRKSA